MGFGAGETDGVSGLEFKALVRSAQLELPTDHVQGLMAAIHAVGLVVAVPAGFHCGPNDLQGLVGGRGDQQFANPVMALGPQAEPGGPAYGISRNLYGSAAED